MIQTRILSLNEIIQFEKSCADRIADTISKLRVDNEKLQLKGSVLHFYSYVEGHEYHSQKDLAKIWMPGSAGFEHPVPLLLYPHHTQAILNSVNQFSDQAKHTKSFLQQATSILSNTSRLIEWALLNDNYQLQSISKNDIKQLCKKLKNGGMPNLLQLPHRLDNFWDTIKNDLNKIKVLVNLDGFDNSALGLRTQMIQKMIGTNCTPQMMPNTFYKSIAKRLNPTGVKTDNGFTEKGIKELQQPSAGRLNALFCDWNMLARQEAEDRISFLPFKNPNQLSRKLGKPVGRTPTIHAEHVTKLLGEAHLWIYKAAPLIIKEVRDLTNLKYSKSTQTKARCSKKYICEKLYTKQMTSSKALNELEKIIGLKISRKSPNSKIGINDNIWNLSECISALMTACYLILQIYNARRQAEIQDPIIGISKREHFRCVNEQYDWYQACFYNEKQGNRYWYTINKGSTKALQTLFELSDAWENTEYLGLFNVPSFVLDDQYNIRPWKYSYSRNSDSKITGHKFNKKVLGDDDHLVNGSHIFRRIYAVIYHYQYEFSELLALCHQLGHVDPEVTEVYVTDPDARDIHEQLQNKVKATHKDITSSAILIKEENKALDKIIKEVDIEKTAADILTLLMGSESMAGRYPAFLKKMFKILRKSVKFNQKIQQKYQSTFSELNPSLQSEEMAKVIFGRGHRCNPKPHNTCHRNSETKASHKAPCDPVQCKSCPYQEIKKIHLKIMKSDLVQLQEISANRYDYLPLERIQASEEANNLSHIITQHERTMKRSQSLFTDN